jgi:hypothetical protein
MGFVSKLYWGLCEISSSHGLMGVSNQCSSSFQWKVIYHGGSNE